MFANAAGHFQQVHRFIRYACTPEFFQISAAVVVADQAIDTCLVSEIEIFVFPAVADVAHGAGRPVGLNADAEIVDDIALADTQGFVVPGQHDLFALPVPVGSLHNLLCRIFVTLQAGTCDRRAICKRFVEETAVVGMCWLLCQPFLGVSAERGRIRFAAA